MENMILIYLIYFRLNLLVFVNYNRTSCIYFRALFLGLSQIFSQSLCKNVIWEIPGGGGGALSIYTGGGVPRHIQKGHESKKGGLKNWSCTKDNLSNWCCTKGGFASLFINYLFVFLDNMINWWVFTPTDQKLGVSGTSQVTKGGLMHGSSSKKWGPWSRVRSKHGGLYCGTYMYWTYMWVQPPPPRVKSPPWLNKTRAPHNINWDIPRF